MDSNSVSINMEPSTPSPTPNTNNTLEPPIHPPYLRHNSQPLPNRPPDIYLRPPSYPNGNPPRYTVDRPPRIGQIGRTTSEGGIQSAKDARNPVLMYARSTPKIRATSRRTPLYPQLATTQGKECVCQCRCSGDINGNLAMRRISEDSALSSTTTSLALTEDLSTEDLSWRRLHMSRAKLKATATTSELLSGFAMVAMVELQINEPTNVPEWLFITFSVTTTVLVAVHIFALMISTYLLPNIDAVSKLHVRGLVAESPHERMRGFIELAWAFSTILGLFLFLVEVGILCWVKFWDYSFTAAWAATIVVVPVLVVFVAFAVHFYHTLVVYKVKAAVTDMKELEDMKLKLDSVTKTGSLA